MSIFVFLVLPVFKICAFKFMKQVIFQEEVFLMKFHKVGTKSLISVFSKLLLSTYSAISHDPLDQSNSLSLF